MVEKILRISERVYRGLLILYPGQHRREYGTVMAQTFRDLSRAVYRKNGGFALIKLWGATVTDLVSSITVEYNEIVKARMHMSPKSLFTLALVLIFSFLTGYVNITATEVQAPMGCILLFSFLAGLIQPKGAWRWALLIGFSIPVSTFVGLAIRFPFPDAPPRYPITLVVLVIPALVAAYGGYLLNRGIMATRAKPA